MKRDGFTLIEMILTLVLLAFIAIFVGQSLFHTMESYFLASANIRITEQAQLALTRMSLELQYANDIKAASGTLLKYNTTKDKTPNEHVLKIEGTNLTLDIGDGSGPHLLLDNLAAGTSFSYRNFSGTTWLPGDNFNTLAHINVELEINHPKINQPLSFLSSIDVRNNGVLNAVPPSTS